MEVLDDLAHALLAGERLEYDVKFGMLKVGSGKMEVLGIETLRGRDAWHTAFTVKGGTFFYKVNDRLESWIDNREDFPKNLLDTYTYNGQLYVLPFEASTLMFFARNRMEPKPVVEPPGGFFV